MANGEVEDQAGEGEPTEGTSPPVEAKAAAREEPGETPEAPAGEVPPAEASSAETPEAPAQKATKKEVGPPPTAKELAELQAAEVAEILGPNVRTPVGIPKEYRPSDLSIEPLLQVELTDFAGPLDLLLYLIKKHDVDIFNIPIKFITDRYLEMLEDMRALQIDVAAEFLVLAAELTHIKSKMLLPAKEGVAAEEELKEEEGDPRAELVRRLLEYQKYRDAADQLSDRDQLGRDVFARQPGVLFEDDGLDPGLKTISIFKLVELMARMMKRTSLHHEISFESFSISERIQHIIAFAEAREGRCTLVQLMETIRSRSELVTTFIAVLEMTKLGLLRIQVELSEPLQDGPTTFERRLPPLPEPKPEPELAEPSAEAELSTDASDLEEGLDEDLELPAWARPEARMNLAETLEAAAKEPKAPPEPLEPLPTIWISLTGKRFEGELLDDYR